MVNKGFTDALTRRGGSVLWTEREIRTLKDYWQIDDMKTLRSRLPGRTWRGVVWKAQDLGLPFGVPRGHESLRAAARRTNYTHKSIRSLCHRQNVKLLHRYPGPGSSSSRFIYVLPDSIDQAIARDLINENVTFAARRLGVEPWLLGALVRFSGRRTKVGGTGVRLPPEVYDELFAAWKSEDPSRLRFVVRGVFKAASARRWVSEQAKSPGESSGIVGLCRVITERGLGDVFARLLREVARSGKLPGSDLEFSCNSEERNGHASDA